MLRQRASETTAHCQHQVGRRSIFGKFDVLSVSLYSVGAFCSDKGQIVKTSRGRLIYVYRLQVDNQLP